MKIPALKMVMRNIFFFSLFTALIACKETNETKKSKTISNQPTVTKQFPQRGGSFNPSLKKAFSGKYLVIGYRLTPKAVDDSISISQMPSFYFSNTKHLKIAPDFSFHLFKDSIFDYKIKGPFLVLSGENSTYKIRFQKQGSNSIRLYLKTKYLTYIDLVLKK